MNTDLLFLVVPVVATLGVAIGWHAKRAGSKLTDTFIIFFILLFAGGSILSGYETHNYWRIFSGCIFIYAAAYRYFKYIIGTTGEA